MVVVMKPGTAREDIQALAAQLGGSVQYDGTTGYWSGTAEMPQPMLPELSSHPLLAAVLGGCFVGVGVGIIVRQGGSSGGDDALALVISHVTHWRLARAYLFTDLTVLGLSLTYIPV